MSILLRRLHKKNTNPKGVRNFFYRKVKEGCECPQEKKEKIVEEKKCIPCSFYNWKPKTRKTIQEQIAKDMTPKPPKECYPGMVTRKTPDCDSAETDPFKKKCCKEKPAKKKPPPPPPPKPEKRLPYADWDSDCK